MFSVCQGLGREEGAGHLMRSPEVSWNRKNCQPIGIITLGVKPLGKHSAGNPHAMFDVAGAGDVPEWEARQSSTLLMRGSWR